METSASATCEIVDVSVEKYVHTRPTDHGPRYRAVCLRDLNRKDKRQSMSRMQQ